MKTASILCAFFLLTGTALAQSTSVARASLNIRGVSRLDARNQLRIDIEPLAVRTNQLRTGLEGRLAEDLNLSDLGVLVDGRPVTLTLDSSRSYKSNEAPVLNLVINLNGARQTIPEIIERAGRLCSAFTGQVPDGLVRVVVASGPNHFCIAESGNDREISAALNSISKAPGKELETDISSVVGDILSRPFPQMKSGVFARPIIAILTSAQFNSQSLSKSPDLGASLILCDFSSLESFLRDAQLPAAERGRNGRQSASELGALKALDPSPAIAVIAAAHTQDRFSEPSIADALMEMTSQYSLVAEVSDSASSNSHVAVVWRIPGVRRPIRADWNAPTTAPQLLGFALIVLGGATVIGFMSSRFSRRLDLPSTLTPSTPSESVDSPADPERTSYREAASFSITGTQKLTWIITGAECGSIPITQSVTIGRAESCSIRLRDADVSAQHLRLDGYADGTLVATDLGSTNGVFVNGARINQRHLLESGAEIRVGNTVFSLSRGVVGQCAPVSPELGNTAESEIQ